jgi:hypothetical protein
MSPHDMPIQVQRGGNIAPTHVNPRSKIGWVVSRMGPCRFTHRQEHLPIIQESGWAPVPVWACTKYRASIGILSPYRQVIAIRCTIYASPTVLLGMDEE